ncbi:PPE family protein [Candidatus Mycobacterium methanotrophicum]|uniref:PPE family protein n=1 Tax=Candidatus Mycobacterium methanotrophicum TaxID=2943498 RepID=A0ABY4QNW6_9MYCO|nr:PPE family protein [Candidatus Mycobacterium methanotrophicum]UQX12702.1 PPE family protein [Candidatus Mycobacterium methanotrophicum]
MVFDFAAQPPEVISGKIYSGPGAEALQAAATAWDGLAGELQSAASSYQSVISGLTSGSWEGPSSASMAAAAAPYVTWISTTAAQAEQTAGQARAAASAYEAALAATVPPAEIAANRSQLASLSQTNIFGQNTSAIAATEAEYGQMWAQDAATMFGYAASSAAATQLTKFCEPPRTTNGSGETTQSAAVAAASTTSTSSDAETIAQQLQAGFSTFSTDIIGLDTHSFAGVTNTLPTGSDLSTLWSDLYSLMSGVGGQATWTNVVNSTASLGISQWKNFSVYQPWSHGIPLGALNGGLASPGHVAPGLGARAASAVLGSAQTVGTLSAPPSWAGATPAIKLASTALPGTSFAAAPATDIPLGVLNQGTLGSLTGGALGSPAARVVSSTGVRARITRGQRSKAPVKLDKVIAQLQQQPEAVQHWTVDQAGLDDLVARLSTKPGIHAVHVCADEKAPATAAKRESQLG